MEIPLRLENRPSPYEVLVVRPGFSPSAKAPSHVALMSLVCLCLFGFLSTGCVSKSQARLQSEKAFLEGQQKAVTEQQQQQQPVVWFRGDVRNQRIPWTEGLTLTRALLAAQYTWSWDPKVIVVTRAGVPYPVDPKRLLRGLEDPELEPGDLVEVRH